METLLQKAQRLGVQPASQPPVPETLLQKAQRLGIEPKKPATYQGAVLEAGKQGVGQLRQGFEQVRDATNPLQVIRGGLTTAAGAVNTASAPLAPIFSPVGKAIDYVGDKISDLPAVQKFAQSGLGNITAQVAEDITNLMTVAGAVGGVKQAKVSAPKIKAGISSFSKAEKSVPTPEVSPEIQRYVNKRTMELAKVTSQNANLRKFAKYAKDQKSTVRRIAETDVLDGAVDEDGVIRTGEAVERYTEATLGEADNLVRRELALEGKTVTPEELQIRLTEAVNKSGLEGADLKIALAKVKKEIAGYKLRANEIGQIPLEIVQDAKIAKKANYLTPPEVQAYNKAIKSGLQQTIEKNSELPIGDINKSLGKYLQDIEFLELLDGKRVHGGKFGKYFAQISGNIIGNAIGNAVAGPGGAAIATIVGGELSSRIRASSMARTFNGKTNLPIPKDPVLQESIARVKSGEKARESKVTVKRPAND